MLGHRYASILCTSRRLNDSLVFFFFYLVLPASDIVGVIIRYYKIDYQMMTITVGTGPVFDVYAHSQAFNGSHCRLNACFFGKSILKKCHKHNFQTIMSIFQNLSF